MAMKIGELAERAGTSVKTIRYYDDVGVLPAQERTPSGYRLYGEGALDRYRFVRAAQAVGFRLGEIRALIALRDQDQAPCEFVARLIERRSTALDQLIADLEALRDELREIAVVRGSPGTPVTGAAATQGSRDPKGSPLCSGGNPDYSGHDSVQEVQRGDDDGC
jgi:DNA-binding transcriptional MerR regulator